MNEALIIYLFLQTLGLGMGIALHGEERKPNNGWNDLISYIIAVGLVLGAVYNK